ncbi:MAG: hypothetical protein ABW128_16960 [Rhizorhabdus sp.]
MTKIFAPPLDTIWRLLDLWDPPESFMDRADNDETLYGEKGYYFKEFEAETGMKVIGVPPLTLWVPHFKQWTADRRLKRGLPQFKTGTVITFDRYHISHSGDHAITLRVLASPDPLLTPRKQGGKMRGAGRLYFKVEELNTLPDMEQVHDFQTG